MEEKGYKILLSNGLHALVSCEDYSRLKDGHWIMTTIHGKPFAYRRATSGPTTLEQQWKCRKHIVRLRPRLYLQREVLSLKQGDPPRVYFKNGNTLDCRRSNLIVKTGGSAIENKQVKGRKRFRASIFVNGRHIFLGHWFTEADAKYVTALAAPIAHQLRGTDTSHAQIKKRLQEAAGIL